MSISNDQEIRFPKAVITADLFGDNAFAILGAASRALRKAGATKEDIDLYRKQAMSGDYEHLMQVTLKWVNVE